MLSAQYTDMTATRVPVAYRPIEVKSTRHYVYVTQFDDDMPTLAVPRADLHKLIAALQQHAG
jgi:hypothetical protein